ncbi:MAG: 3-oxoacyl-ACP synthase III, partial [Candidatus Hodarchaeota archaeon]
KLYDMASEAVQKTIDQAGINAQEIGCLVNTSVCRDYLEPSQASLIHGNLDLSPHCLNFDITNACLGFVNGMEIVRSLIQMGKIKYGMVVSSEGSIKGMERTLRRIQDPNCTMETYRANFATFTIGSGAVAMLLAHEDVSQTEHVINGSVTMTDTANDHNKLCIANSDYSEMITDPQGLLIHGMPLAVKTWAKGTKNLENWSAETVDIYVPHQTSTRQIDAFAKNCRLPRDKFHLTLQTLGNVISAALPLTLASAIEKKAIKSGDHAALMGIGSGLNCTMMSVSW